VVKKDLLPSSFFSDEDSIKHHLDENWCIFHQIKRFSSYSDNLREVGSAELDYIVRDVKTIIKSIKYIVEVEFEKYLASKNTDYRSGSYKLLKHKQNIIVAVLKKKHNESVEGYIKRAVTFLLLPTKAGGRRVWVDRAREIVETKYSIVIQTGTNKDDNVKKDFVDGWAQNLFGNSIAQKVNRALNYHFGATFYYERPPKNVKLPTTKHPIEIDGHRYHYTLRNTKKKITRNANADEHNSTIVDNATRTLSESINALVDAGIPKDQIMSSVDSQVCIVQIMLYCYEKLLSSFCCPMHH